MRLLIDENLPPHLAVWLCDLGHDAIHVQRAVLVGQTDANLQQRAVAEDRVIVTKDKDFDHGPARVMRLAIGNVRTAELITWLEPRLAQAGQRLRDGELHIVID